MKKILVHSLAKNNAYKIKWARNLVHNAKNHKDMQTKIDIIKTQTDLIHLNKEQLLTYATLDQYFGGLALTMFIEQGGELSNQYYKNNTISYHGDFFMAGVSFDNEEVMFKSGHISGKYFGIGAPMFHAKAVERFDVKTRFLHAKDVYIVDENKIIFGYNNKQ